MNEREIWLTDPAGGGMIESGDVLVVQHTNLRVIGTAYLPEPALFDPGELRVTQAALDDLGGVGVVQAYAKFLRGEWGYGERDDIQANNQVIKDGRGAIYDRPTLRTLIVSYLGSYTTLLLNSEY